MDPNRLRYYRLRNIFHARTSNFSSMRAGIIIKTGIGLVSAFQIYQHLRREQSSPAYASVRTNQALYGWGSCSKGQIGIGREVNVLPIPTLISDLEGQQIVSMSCMGDKSSAINSYGELFTWGSVKNNSLLDAQGKPFKENLKQPALFATDEAIFKQVAVGKEHIAVITDDGRLYTMGSTDHGKLGHQQKELTDEEKQQEVLRYKKAGYRPGQQLKVQGAVGFVTGNLTGKKIVSVDCGASHTVVVTTDGDVYTWGRGKFGALGHGDTKDIHQPKKVEGLSGIIEVKCGDDYTFAKDQSGKLHVFGSNSYGQLGLNQDQLKVLSPTKLFLPASQGKVTDFSCGEEHSAYIDSHGTVHTFGYGQDGQLGHSAKESLKAPKRLNLKEKSKRVHCGGGHTGIITEAGDLYLMGRGRDGQLGRGGEVESIATPRSEPTLVEYFRQNNLEINELALGSNHSVALATPRSR